MVGADETTELWRPLITAKCLMGFVTDVQTTAFCMAKGQGAELLK